MNTLGDKPARMLADNCFKTELPLQSGSNSIAIAATDTSGNRSHYQFQVDVASQSTPNFGYDLDGNLTSDGTRSYEWDILSRLIEITWATGKTTDFKYSALGQRCDRTDTDGSTVTNNFYLFDGLQMLDHRSGTTASTATIDRRYLSQGEQRKNGANWENYYYSRDHLGSIREVVKSVGTTNTLVARYDYDPYGKRLPQYEALGYTCDLGYTGHVTVPSLVTGQTEMVLTLFRAYDPQLGIWLSSDPLGEAGGINLYAYCYGNPLNFYDPDGMMAAPPPGFFSWNDTAGDWAENAANFSMGMADNLSFGLNGKVCEGIYGNDYSDPCSNSYKGGEWAGTAVGLAMGGAHLGRNAIAQMGKSGNLLQRLGRGMGRLGRDNRTWGSVRSTWSKATGGLLNKGQHLHHAFIPQRWGWIPQSIRNSGFNYMPLSAKFNSWMNGSTAGRSLVELGI